MTAVDPRAFAALLAPVADRRHLVLIADGGDSGLSRSGAVLDEARHALAARGAMIETHLTESVDELAAPWPDLQERRVVLRGGDGTVHTAANLPLGPAELALLPAGTATAPQAAQTYAAASARRLAPSESK